MIFLQLKNYNYKYYIHNYFNNDFLILSYKMLRLIYYCKQIKLLTKVLYS